LIDGCALRRLGGLHCPARNLAAHPGGQQHERFSVTRQGGLPGAGMNAFGTVVFATALIP